MLKPMPPTVKWMTTHILSDLTRVMSWQFPLSAALFCLF